MDILDLELLGSHCSKCRPTVMTVPFVSKLADQQCKLTICKRLLCNITRPWQACFGVIFLILCHFSSFFPLFS